MMDASRIVVIASLGFRDIIRRRAKCISGHLRFILLIC